MPAVKKPTWIRQEEEISKILKKALIDKGWTVAHLAELIKKDVSSVSRILNHPLKVRLETVLNIAEKLSISSIPIIR